MDHHKKAIPTLFIFLTVCVLGFGVARVHAEIPIADYFFETIEVPGVDFLEVAASNDFGDYAGNTRSPDGEKIVGFTLIDGVFKRYQFLGALNTFFYALDNTGKAAGHYKDIDGLYHGVILEGGELRQYDFPGAAETHIYGISDETGALSGNIVDEAGTTHAFSGELTITFPGAVNTYGDFVNAAGAVVGSYIDADGMFHGFIRHPDGSFTTIDLPTMPNLRYLFVNTITDFGVIGFRAKAANDILRSYILLPDGTLYEVRIPGSVITVVRNVNQDGSIVGYYDLADGRRLGFLGRPNTQPASESFGNIFSIHLSQGLNMLSVPLKPTVHMTARTLAVKTNATTVITLDAENQQFVGWTLDAPDDGFSIEGGNGYIVNLPMARDIVFTGTAWTNLAEAAPAIPPLIRGDRGVVQEAWAFVVTGHLNGKPAFDGYQVIVRNLRTNSAITASVRGSYFAAATADLSRRSVVQIGDEIEVHVVGPGGVVESQTLRYKVTREHLANAVMSVKLDGIGKPKLTRLLQNYPNPFNPETWIPYQLSEDSPVTVSIYDTTGKLIRNLPLGIQSAGFYNSRDRAAYWDGRNAEGEGVASGAYFYQLTTPSFHQTRQLVIIK
ncbi:MAG: T9SS type A sorting domain-containing protein [Candidatus Poribacteria bacterium]|nr:T9SS type A sorting domain-containing protein [Candidatus Poribacteria bacterium]